MAAKAVRSVELIHFCANVDDCPSGPQFDLAFSGRSNVGKSSLINMLTRRKKLAYTSKSPGKTQCFTYYRVNDAWNLVDMPGYGYAKVPVGERRKWAREAARYYREREQLRGVLQLIDFKVGATDDDIARIEELVELGHPLCVVLTKADKVPPSRREKVVVEHLRQLGPGLRPDTAVVVTSSAKGHGAGELWAWMEDLLQSGTQD
jgi:GTP-binding protein